MNNPEYSIFEMSYYFCFEIFFDFLFVKFRTQNEIEIKT